MTTTCTRPTIWGGCGTGFWRGCGQIAKCRQVRWRRVRQNFRNGTCWTFPPLSSDTWTSSLTSQSRRVPGAHGSLAGDSLTSSRGRLGRWLPCPMWSLLRTWGSWRASRRAASRWPSCGSPRAPRAAASWPTATTPPARAAASATASSGAASRGSRPPAPSLSCLPPSGRSTGSRRAPWPSSCRNGSCRTGLSWHRSTSSSSAGSRA
mmetsp:Transcript_23577/g.67983  ORF Transcript_23577/g.67983 Transcript_23577/m.67983 type:complete len:207 (+) Transcript_23577:2745-3365(+)